MCYSVTNNMDDKIKDKQVIHKETDIVDFVEEFLGIKLFDFQKQMLRYLQKYPDAQIIPLRGRSSSLLMALLIAKAIFESQKEEREDKSK